MSAALVSFTQRSSAGSQAVTGVGFEPKAVILWTPWRSSTGLFDGAEICEGASDGVKQFARCMSVEVANAAGSVGLTFDAILRRLTTTTGSAPSELCAASLTSLDSDGFTLDWSVSDAGGATIYAIAIGGDGLEAALLTGTVPSGTTTALTGAGFEPTAVMVWPGYTGVPYAHGLFAARDSWGFATSVAQVCSATIEIAAFGNKKRTMGTVVDAKVATVMQENGILGGGIASNHKLLSFGTDGLSLSDWHGSFGGTADMAVLCLRGVVVAVGEVIIPTSPGTVSETAGVAPELLLLQTVDLTLGGNAVSNGARFGIGCWTDDAQVTVGAGSDTTGEFTAAHDDTAIRIYQPGATSGASTLRVAATVASIESDGFTLDCTTVTGSSTPIQYLAIGPSDAGVSSRNLLTGSSHTVQGSDNLIVGANGTVTGDKNALFALCDDSPAPEIVGNRKFKACADAIDLSADGNVSVDAADILFNGTSVKNAITALTGDVTATGPGSVSGTIANDAVTNAKSANMAAATIKGRAVGAGTGDPTDLSGTQATAILDNMVGDSGSGGTKGLAPAPAAGDAAAAKFLKANGTWAVPAGTGGSGTVTHTGALTANQLVVGNGTDDIKVSDLTGDVTTSGGVATTLKTAAKTRAITCVFDNGSSVIASGMKKVYVYVPYACTITAVTMLADAAGAAVLGIKKCAYGSFPGSLTNIVASAPPTIGATNQNSQDSTLTGWTTSITAGDVLEFSVTSGTTITSLFTALTVTV